MTKGTRRTLLPQRAQEFQQRVEALLGLIHVDLVPRTFDHDKARVGNQRAHRDLIGQRRKRAPRRREDEGRYVDLRQQRRGIRTIYVGPEEPLNIEAFDDVILAPATQGLPKILQSFESIDQV